MTNSEQGAGELKTFWQEKIDGGAGLSWQEATYLLDYYITLCENVENVKKMNDTLDTVNSRLQAKVADLEKDLQTRSDQLIRAELERRQGQARVQALEAALHDISDANNNECVSLGEAEEILSRISFILDKAFRPSQGETDDEPDTWKCPKCGSQSTWFDRSISLRADGKERMATLCGECGFDVDIVPGQSAQGKP